MKQELNNLIMRFKESNQDTDFTEIYNLTVKKASNTFQSTARSLLTGEADVQELYEDVLMKCISEYNGMHDFENFYKNSLKNRRADTYRKTRRMNERDLYIVDKTIEEDKGAATLEPVDEKTPETIYFNKKRADQRQLIDSLLEKADETTRQIVETFLGCDRPNPTAIGKRLGLHHSTVIRKLEKLAGSFDTKQFGNYRDYLVVSE
ncbi:sigma-70 family RNA polymerase sigma factor [Bacillus safensis]|uniref:sigma-70 family RNA polymerase sigma factor n=1 Tax=Bacillus safensis TaxID=561879 RepID=UPI002FFF2DB0